ncbi:protein of unknown function [Methylocaldum szegediense]|uniref:Uncharacterized protein n=1 Tax=Methylocaldum szegediense TaxID=73780 RepID=A0ABN8WXS3_9GAMM|nr:protein of unknown function [Methylocaldum szegediense]
MPVSGLREGLSVIDAVEHSGYSGVECRNPDAKDGVASDHYPCALYAGIPYRHDGVELNQHHRCVYRSFRRNRCGSFRHRILQELI